MAEAGEPVDKVEDVLNKVQKTDINTFAKIIQEKFAEARDYRRDHDFILQTLRCHPTGQTS